MESFEGRIRQQVARVVHLTVVLYCLFIVKVDSLSLALVWFVFVFGFSQLVSPLQFLHIHFITVSFSFIIAVRLGSEVAVRRRCDHMRLGCSPYKHGRSRSQRRGLAWLVAETDPIQDPLRILVIGARWSGKSSLSSRLILFRRTSADPSRSYIVGEEQADPASTTRPQQPASPNDGDEPEEAQAGHHPKSRCIHQ